MELAVGGERTIDGIGDGRRIVLGHPKTPSRFAPASRCTS